MADEQSGGTGTPVTGEDPIKNVKSEFDRKLEAINSQIAAQNQFYAEQFNTIQSLIKESKSSAPSADDDKALEQMAFNEPVKYAKVVRDQAAQAATEAANRIAAEQSARQNLLVQMVAEYPELNDTGSDLYRQVMDASKKLSANEQANNLIIKGLIASTAADLGVLPKSRRSASPSDGFTLGGSRGGTQAPRRAEKTEVSQETLLFAQLLGRDVNDPKVRKGLEEAAARTTWNKYR